jgi:DNA-binding HxlR family transcriptional regulator
VKGRAEQPFGPGCVVLRLAGYESVREIAFGLEGADRRPQDLRRDHALARTTLYNHVDQMIQMAIVVRRETAGPPWTVVYENGQSGDEFRDLLRGWASLLGTANCHDRMAPLHFAEAWAGGIVGALLDGPLMIGEVVKHCHGCATAPQVDRLIRQLRTHGYVGRSGRRQTLLDTGRLAIGELAASARFERRHSVVPIAPITATRAVDALRGTLPLVSLPGQAKGICEFVVRDASAVGGARAAACWMEVEAGRVISTGAGNAPRAATVWVQGTIDEWLSAVIDRRSTHLQASGERGLGRNLVKELHAELYG